MEKLRISLKKPKHDWALLESGGDAESGPITTIYCKTCGKVETIFGL